MASLLPASRFNSDTCFDLSIQTESCDTLLIITPVGRLKINEWKLITSNEHVLDVIQHGYKIPFETEPNETDNISLIYISYIKNNRSSIDNQHVVKSEIVGLLKKGCISEVHRKPKVVNPLTVTYNKSSKPRMVLDCKHINPHLFKFRFKYEDSAVAWELFRKNDYLFGYDLKSHWDFSRT